MQNSIRVTATHAFDLRCFIKIAHHGQALNRVRHSFDPSTTQLICGHRKHRQSLRLFFANDGRPRDFNSVKLTVGLYRSHNSHCRRMSILF